MKNEYYTEISRRNSKYVACNLSIKWNVLQITGEKTSNGYIVQYFRRQFDSKNDFLDGTSYYEAWRVKNGKVLGTKDYDDLFAIGHPLNSLEMLKYDHGKSGRVIFSSDVYWIPCSSALSQLIDSWDENTIKDAKGLKSSYTFNGLSHNYFVFQRPTFVHTWDLSSKERVFNIVTEAMISYYSNYNSTWERNVNIDIENIFHESCFIDIKENARQYIIHTIKTKEINKNG